MRLIIPVRLLRGLPVEGRFTLVHGDVKVRNESAGDWAVVQIGDTVRQGSSISTGADSAAEVMFENGDMMLLRSETDLSIQTAWKKGSSHFFSDLMVRIGRVISDIKRATGSDSRFRIRTPSSLTSVRGTDFRVSNDAEDTARTEVLSGEVRVTARKKNVAVGEGQGTVVRSGQPPIQPRCLIPPPRLPDPVPFYKSLPIRFSLTAPPEASLIRVILSEDKESKKTVKDVIVRTSRSVDFHNISDGTYFLVSQSIDDLGLEGPPSEPYAVNVRTNPNPPYTEEPPGGYRFRKRTGEFSWLKVADAVRYQVQVAADETFKDLREERDGVTKERYTTGELDYGAYIFRVRSVAADGFEGEWSNPVHFTLSPPPPTPSPEPPAVNEAELRIRMNDLGEGITYRVQVARDIEFREILIDRVQDRPDFMIAKPAAPGTYYVRSSSIDKTGEESAFSPAQSFEIRRDILPYVIGGIVTFGLFFILIP
jgi:hypothetical protein